MAISHRAQAVFDVRTSGVVRLPLKWPGGKRWQLPHLVAYWTAIAIVAWLSRSVED